MFVSGCSMAILLSSINLWRLRCTQEEPPVQGIDDQSIILPSGACRITFKAYLRPSSDVMSTSSVNRTTLHPLLSGYGLPNKLSGPQQNSKIILAPCDAAAAA